MNRNIYVVPPRSFFLFNNKLNIIKIAPAQNKSTILVHREDEKKEPKGTKKIEKYIYTAK